MGRNPLSDTNQLRECDCIGWSCRKCKLAWAGINAYFIQAGIGLRTQYEKNLNQALMENKMLNSEWKGPLYCPICGTQALAHSGRNMNYSCDNETCGWEVTDSEGMRIRDIHDKRGSVSRGEEIDRLVAARSNNNSLMSAVVQEHELGLKQSENKQQFDTGAQRDSEGAKGNFALLPFAAAWSHAARLTLGAEYYEKHNWRKGIPTERAFSAALRHVYQAIEVFTREELRRGGVAIQYDDDIEKEDHLGAAMFNLGVVIQNRYDRAHRTDGVHVDDQEATNVVPTT